MITGVLELNLLFLVAGIAIVWGLRGWNTWGELGADLGLAYMLGLSAVGVTATVALVAGLGLSSAVIIALVVGIAAVGALIGYLRRHPLPRTLPGSLSVPRTLGDLLSAIAVVATVLIALLMFRAFVHQPVGSNDAFAFWLPKAKAIFFFGGLDPSLFRTLPAPSYPLFVPALDAMDFRFVHAADPTALNIQYWLLLIGFLGSAAALLRGTARRGLIALFLALAATIPELEHRFFQLVADWPLDIFFVLGALCLIRWLLTREPWLLGTYVIVLSAMLATKREGQLLAACLFAGAVVASARTWRKSWPVLLAVSVAAYAVNVPWRIWWTSRNLAPDTPDGGLGHSIHSFARFLPSLRIVLQLTFDYKLWLLCVPIALIAAGVALTTRGVRAPATFYLVTAATTVLGFTWVLWSNPTLPLSTVPRLTPIPRAMGSLALLSVVFAPVLVTRLVADQPFPLLGLSPRQAFTTGMPRARDWVLALSPIRVLAFFVVAQWLVIVGIAAQVRHKGWIFYMGGDQLWYYTTGWLLGHGRFPQAGVGYLLPALEAPLAIFRGPNLVQALPFILVVNVVVLIPIVLFALYGIAARIGGRLFAYWTLTLWILVPLAGIPFTNGGYHQKYTELTLPQALGLTALADFPTLVATLVSVYFCAKIVFDANPRLLDGLAAGAAGGAAIGFKPAATLFLLGPALALVVARRYTHMAAFAAGIAPAVVTLTVWKWRGFGHLPITGAYRGVRLAAGTAGAPLLGLNLHKYVNFDWSHFGNNLDLLREHFWSGRLLEWLAVAGAVGLALASKRAFFLIVGWFGAYLVIRWTSPHSSIEDASLLRLMIPSYPAFVLMLAAIPLLVPRVARRVRSEVGGFRPPDRRIRSGLVLLALVVTAAAPLAAIALASPVRGPSTPLAGFLQTALIPTDVDLKLRAQTTGRVVTLTWRTTHPLGGPVFYKAFRGPVLGTFSCAGATAQRCQYQGTEIGIAAAGEFVDHPPKGTWAYQIGIGANWLDDPAAGDVYVLSAPIDVTVP